MDSTTRQPDEETDRRSELRYQTLFETLIEGFCTIEMIFDEAGKPVDYRFLEVNPAFAKQTGLYEAQGKSMRELAPEHEAHWFELYGKVALTGEPIHFENEAKALGRHYDVRAYRVGGPGSRHVGILFNDITDRKRAEVRVQAQLARLNLLQQITRAIAERQDIHSIFQVVIRTLEEHLPADFCCIGLHEAAAGELLVSSVGLHGESVLAMPAQARVDIKANGLSGCLRGQLIYDPEISQTAFPFPKLLAAAGLKAMVAAPLLVEGQLFGVLFAARRSGNGFSSGESEFLSQIAEHVALAAHQAQLHGALQQAYDDLRQTQRAVVQQERLLALGQLASGIAHDINNAISPVSLYTELLLTREPGLSSGARKQLETIQCAVDDVARTVARMREFYRQREPQLTLLPVDINTLVQQSVDLTRARWSDMVQRRGAVIDLRTELAADLPAIMGADNEIREALINLIFNAVDAMPQGGALTLRTRVAPQSGVVQVEVSDAGIGMNEETRRRCLEPFFTTKGERGTGLGLAMVYGTVQRHSAEIEIESAVGQGTTMRLSFALATRSAVVPAEAGAVNVVPALRILLVDDDPLLLSSLRDTLENDGHRVTAAPGGQAGIDAFVAANAQADPFQIVITDLGMPYVDGRKVSSTVKAIAPATIVLLLTGWGQRLAAEGDVPPHVDAVLSKPPKLRDLREAMARAWKLMPCVAVAETTDRS